MARLPSQVAAWDWGTLGGYRTDFCTLADTARADVQRRG